MPSLEYQYPFLVLKFHGIPYNKSDADTGWILYVCDGSNGTTLKVIGRQHQQQPSHHEANANLCYGYTSFIDGLEYIDRHNISTQNLCIECDSELIVNQLMGVHNSHAIKNPILLKMYARSKGLLNKLRYQKSYNKVFFEHVAYQQKEEDKEEQKKTNE